MKKYKVRINLDVSEELAIKLRTAADSTNISTNAFIRMILTNYFADQSKNKKE